MNHYFSPDPLGATDRRTIELTLPDVTLRLSTDRGVFSADRVDTGTKLLLLDGPAPTAGDRVLVDVGAGYGPIALTLAARNPDAQVWAVEVNRRARELCVDNAASNGLTNVRVVEPDEFPADLVVDRFWSNPPIRVGKPALHQLLDTWLVRLAPSGSAHLVVQKHLGADSLAVRLTAKGWRVDRRGSKKAFRLLDVRSAPPPTPPPTPHLIAATTERAKDERATTEEAEP